MQSLARLAEIQARISTLRSEAGTILNAIGRDLGLSGGVKGRPEAAPAVPTASRPSKAATKARRKMKRSPSGPLAPAVAKILASAGRPLRVAEIFDALTASNYAFSTPDPKKNLSVRIYQLAGVKSLGDGLFGPA